MSARRKISALAIGLCLVAAAPSAFADDCAPLEKAFNAAVAKGSTAAVKDAAKNWKDDFVCGENADAIDAKYLGFLIKLAEADSSQRGAVIGEVEKKLATLRDWRVAESLGDFYWKSRDVKSAYHWYEESLNFLKGHPNQHPGQKEIQALMTKTGSAKSDERGVEVAKGEFFKTRAVDGTLGGIYVRQVVEVSVPLPVRFYYNEARFTPEGETAVRELAEAAKQQHLTSMKLVGHTDPKGSDAYNMELSRKRVEAVRDALRREGVSAHIDISWQGKRQPLDVSVLAAPPESEDQLWAMERRVEWIREGGE